MRTVIRVDIDLHIPNNSQRAGVLVINFSTFPVLQSSRLILRAITEKDTGDLFAMRKNVRMHEHTDTKPDNTPADTEAYIQRMNKGVSENKWIIWAMEHKQSQRVIGTISIWNIAADQQSAELGYGVIPDYQGQGLMKEALMCVVEYGFEVMKLRTIEAYTEENHLQSCRLLESAGFSEAKRMDEKGYCTNRIYRMIVYTHANADWDVHRV